MFYFYMAWAAIIYGTHKFEQEALFNVVFVFILFNIMIISFKVSDMMEKEVQRRVEEEKK